MKEELFALLEKAGAITAKAEREGRNLTAEEAAEVKGILAEAKPLKDKIVAAGDEADLRRQIHDLGVGVELVEKTDPKAARVILPKMRAGSIADQMLADPEMGAFLAKLPNLPAKARIEGPVMQFATLLTGGSDTSGGAMVFNDVQPGVVMVGRRELTLRQLITNGQTGSDTVEFVRETSETNNAAPVAEANVTTEGDAVGKKPESAVVFAKVTTPVVEIGHWIPATKRALSDAGQLRTLVDQFLRYGLEEELEDQMVGGDGQGQNLTGIGQTSNIQTQAWVTNEFDTLRKAKTKVRMIGRRRATAYLMNAYNWETIELKKDSQNRYYGGGPYGATPPTLWGLPVAQCEAVPDGVAYCGAFDMATLWDREAASIAVSDSHSDFFIRGLVAIVASMRVAFGVLKPNAFVEVDLSERS